MLSRVESYHKYDEVIRGFYFNTDDTICHFNFSQTDTTFAVEDISPNKKPCGASSEFFHCPQPWCYSNQVDAPFTTNVLSHDHKTKLIYLMKNGYYWRVKVKPLPLDTQRMTQAFRS